MKGMLLPAIILFVLIAFTCFVILLFLPNFLWLWQTIGGYVGAHPPVTIQAVFRPSYVPLTADHALFSLLASTEEKTGKQVQELLAYAVFYGKKEFKVDGVKVNMDEIINSKLKALVPDKDFALFVKSENYQDLEFGNPNLLADFTVSQDYCPTPSPMSLISPTPIHYMSVSTLTLPDLSKSYVVLYLG